jgi:hypothetical protein
MLARVSSTDLEDSPIVSANAPKIASASATTKPLRKRASRRLVAETAVALGPANRLRPALSPSRVRAAPVLRVCRAAAAGSAILLSIARCPQRLQFDKASSPATRRQPPDRQGSIHVPASIGTLNQSVLSIRSYLGSEVKPSCVEILLDRRPNWSQAEISCSWTPEIRNARVSVSDPNQSGVEMPAERALVANRLLVFEEHPEGPRREVWISGQQTDLGGAAESPCGDSPGARRARWTFSPSDARAA